MVGVTVQVLATLPAVQLVKFFVINVLLEPVIVRSESHCIQSDPLPKIDSSPAGMNHSANLPRLSRIGTYHSSAAPDDTVTVFLGLIALGAQDAPSSV